MYGVAFTLQKCDILGIFGVNGAGKSTLLKAISGVMTPTRGAVTARGKISELLERASGFDKDLTVRKTPTYAAPCLATPAASWTKSAGTSSALRSWRSLRTDRSGSCPPA